MCSSCALEDGRQYAPCPTTVAGTCRHCFKPIEWADDSNPTRSQGFWRHVDPQDDNTWGSHKAEALVNG